METDCEIIFTVILPFPLIQERQLSVTDKSMYTKYWLNALYMTVIEDIACPRKVCVG